MPSGSYKQVNVKCPFYKHDDGKRTITCEGIVEDSSLTNSFRRKRDFEMQINVYCSGCYQKCEVYMMLVKQYDEGD